MDLLDLRAGLALLAFAGAAAGLAWARRRRAAVPPRDAGHAADEVPQPPEGPMAHHAAAQAVIEQARAVTQADVHATDQPAAQAAGHVAAHAGPAVALHSAVPAPVPALAAQFDGPDWAPTEPMPGIASEPSFADTEPAGMDLGGPGFADTMPAEPGFAATHFAVTHFAATHFAATHFAETQVGEAGGDLGVPR